ncbi:MAG TPA: DUF192 domain-containing protein [Methylocystis sp.]|nr:DUF192 domain-containing protein [Methylocystis sp.]
MALARLLFAVAALCGVLAFASARAAPAVEKLEFVTAEGVKAVEVEVARTVKEREYGLMNRKEMAKNHGMLFLFGLEEPVAMWMKDTYIPLDMVFVSRDGRISGIARDAVPLSETIIPSGAPAYAVIELNGGAAREMSLAVGDRVRHPAFAPK